VAPLEHEIVRLPARGRRQEVGQLVVETRVALEGGLQRIQPHRRVPVFIVDAVQLRGLVLLDRQRTGCGAARRCAGWPCPGFAPALRGGGALRLLWRGVGRGGGRQYQQGGDGNGERTRQAGGHRQFRKHTGGGACLRRGHE